MLTVILLIQNPLNVDLICFPVKEIRNNIHINAAVTVSKSVTQPHLDYCDIVWDAVGQLLKGKLQEMQEKMLEIAYQGVKVNDTNTLHRLCKTLPIY